MEPKLVKFLPALILLPIGIALGFSSLRDPDLGWHIASGLWMLKTHTVPEYDFLSQGGREWIAYSWLPELLFGVVYQTLGFRGLQVLQMILILCVSWAVFMTVPILMCPHPHVSILMCQSVSKNLKVVVLRYIVISFTEGRK